MRWCWLIGHKWVTGEWKAGADHLIEVRSATCHRCHELLYRQARDAKTRKLIYW